MAKGDRLREVADRRLLNIAKLACQRDSRVEMNNTYLLTDPLKERSRCLGIVAIWAPATEPCCLREGKM